jgi:hypothetical protein
MDNISKSFHVDSKIFDLTKELLHKAETSDTRAWDRTSYSPTKQELEDLRSFWDIADNEVFIILCPTTNH